MAVASDCARARSAGLLALAASALLTLLMAAPVLQAPTERIFGSEISGRHHDPYTVIRQFGGAPVTPPYLQPATDIPGRLLGRVMHPTAAYNLVVLATFPLAALFACLLAFELTGARGVSVAAGLAFAFSPFHLAHAVDHPHIAQVQWIALFLLAIWWSVHGITATRALILAAAAVLVVLSNFYGGLIALAVAPFAVALFWVTPSRTGRSRQWRDLAGTVLVLLVVAIGGLAAAWRLTPGVLEDPQRYRAARVDTVRYSARPWAYLLPPVDHAVMGASADARLQSQGVYFGRLEQQIYLGIGVLFLAGVAIWGWTRRDPDPTIRAVPAWAALGVLAFVCSLSPEWQIGGITVPGPSALLYSVAPMFRAFARFAVVVQLAAVILAALAATTLLGQRRSRAGLVMVSAIAALTVFEYAPVPWRWRDVLPTGAHRWFAAHDRAVRVFDCTPLVPGERHTAWLGGFPLRHRDRDREDCADPDVGHRLGAGRFTHLIVRRDDPAFEWMHARGRPGLRPFREWPDAMLFEVQPPASVLFVAEMEGLYPREFGPDTTWRWSPGETALTIVNAGAPQRVTLHLPLGAAFAERRVAVLLNGRPLDVLNVRPSMTTHELGPLEIPRGRVRIELRSDEPPIVPVTLGVGSKDRRRLAFAVGEWRWE